MLTADINRGYRRGTDVLDATPGVTLLAAGSTDDAPAVPGEARLYLTNAGNFLAHPELAAEVFGPASLIVRVRDEDELRAVVDGLEGQLTATIHLGTTDERLATELLGRLESVAGRLIVNGWPTGVDVGHAMVHGGPYPATSAPATTSVGTRAIERFLRPVVYQDVPPHLLPDELRPDNPAGVPRMVDGVHDNAVSREGNGSR